MWMYFNHASYLTDNLWMNYAIQNSLEYHVL